MCRFVKSTQLLINSFINITVFFLHIYSWLILHLIIAQHWQLRSRTSDHLRTLVNRWEFRCVGRRDTRGWKNKERMKWIVLEKRQSDSIGQKKKRQRNRTEEYSGWLERRAGLVCYQDRGWGRSQGSKEFKVRAGAVIESSLRWKKGQWKCWDETGTGNTHTLKHCFALYSFPTHTYRSLS